MSAHNSSYIRETWRLGSATDKSTRVRCLFFLCLSAHNSSYIGASPSLFGGRLWFPSLVMPRDFICETPVNFFFFVLDLQLDFVVLCCSAVHTESLAPTCKQQPHTRAWPKPRLQNRLALGGPDLTPTPSYQIHILVRLCIRPWHWVHLHRAYAAAMPAEPCLWQHLRLMYSFDA